MELRYLDLFIDDQNPEVYKVRKDIRAKIGKQPGDVIKITIRERE